MICQNICVFFFRKIPGFLSFQMLKYVTIFVLGASAATLAKFVARNEKFSNFFFFNKKNDDQVASLPQQTIYIKDLEKSLKPKCLTRKKQYYLNCRLLI